MRGSTVQNSAVMDSQVLNGTDKDIENAYSVRGGLLFTQAAIVLMAGLLLPIAPIWIDILLAINFVFTAMLVFVVLFAREPADITSVPLLVIFVTLFRLGINVAAAKSILLIANGGRIIDWCGAHIYYGFISIVITVIFVFFICVLICKAAIFIRRKAIGYLIETIPTRQASLQAEYDAGIISSDQMLRTKKRIDKQIVFFAGMASTSSLLLCDGVIAIMITLATIFGATALGIMHASPIMAGSPQYSPLALAIAMTTAVPAALVALALQLLINRRFLITLKVQSPVAPAIHVTNRIVKNSASENDAVITTEAVVKSAPEEIVPDEIPAELVDESAVQSPIAVSESGSDAVTEKTAPPQIIRDDSYYDSILAMFGDKRRASILLAGLNASQLPVNIAVEVAIRIIKLHKKCLLIDTDPSRNAVAAAFDIDSDSMQGKAAPTGIENLWVSPAENPDNPEAVKLSRKVANALKVFNYVVIYAPNAAAENVRGQLIGASDAAVIFGVSEGTTNIEEFAAALSSSNCRVVFEQDVFRNGKANS